MNPSPEVALALSLAVSLVGWRVKALTLGGAAFALLVGAAILIGTGWAGGAALLTFFIGSSLVSHGSDPAVQLLDGKGSRRDSWQVLANGGAAAGAALVGILVPNVGIWAVTASLAAAAADTWASGIGARSSWWPRDILTGQPVPPGTSGGVTTQGSLGAAAGALTVAGAAAVVAREPGLVMVGVFVGVAGMFIDSVLGSRCQARFHCSRCDHDCEQPIHRCGTVAPIYRGFRWLTNDGVNAVTTLLTGLIGWGMGLAWTG